MMCLKGLFLHLRDKGFEISPDVLDEGEKTRRDEWTWERMIKRAKGGGLCVQTRWDYR